MLGHATIVPKSSRKVKASSPSVQSGSNFHIPKKKKKKKRSAGVRPVFQQRHSAIREEAGSVQLGI